MAIKVTKRLESDINRAFREKNEIGRITNKVKQTKEYKQFFKSRVKYEEKILAYAEKYYSKNKEKIREGLSRNYSKDSLEEAKTGVRQMNKRTAKSVFIKSIKQEVEYARQEGETTDIRKIVKKTIRRKTFMETGERLKTDFLERFKKSDKYGELKQEIANNYFDKHGKPPKKIGINKNKVSFVESVSIRNNKNKKITYNIYQEADTKTYVVEVIEISPYNIYYQMYSEKAFKDWRNGL